MKRLSEKTNAEFVRKMDEIERTEPSRGAPEASKVICEHCGESIEPTGGKLYLWTHRDPNQQKCIVAHPANGVLPRTATSTHTPGPWEVREWTCHAPTTVMAGYGHKNIVVAECSGHGRSSEESVADARLIAQAPTLLAENETLRAGHVVLLEALRRIRAVVGTSTEAWHIAEAAIQQAERT